MPTQDTAGTEALKAEICQIIDARREEFIELLRDFLRIRSVNPPGDMREAAAFVRAILDRFGVPHRTVAEREDMPNILGRWDAADPGRHLVLNGHMDVFPASAETLWAADIEGDRIVARGASDMKTGTLASILAYCLLHPYRDRLHGALTLAVVSDEQSGGRYGTKFLFDAHEDEITGDCCLNGEPTGLNNIRFMEKGTLRFSLSATSIGGHGGYPHRAPNPIQQITAAVHTIYERYHRTLADLPPEVDAILTAPETVAVADASLGKGAADNARRITVNAGIIQGGQKATQIPTDCTVQMDMRFPVGVERDLIRAELEALATAFGVTMAVNEDHSYPASSTDPYGEMATILRDAIKELTGNDAPPVCSLGGTDGRYWRWRGIPTVICGPSNLSMGSDSENVTLDEAITVMKLHAMCAAEYLSRSKE